MNAEEYLKERLDDQISWYDAKSQLNQKVFKQLRLAEIGAAALIPLLSGFTDPERPYLPVTMGILGAVVAVIAGALALYQFEQNWIQYRTTCESLKKEKFRFLTGSKPFDGTEEENLRLLVDRVESLISRENTEWAERAAHREDRAEEAAPAA